MYLLCDGVITQVGADPQDSGAFQCSVAWQVAPVSEFNPADLDPVLIAGAVGAGFFSLVPLWLAAVGARALIKAIR